MFRNFDEMLQYASKLETQKVALVGSEDEEGLRALKKAQDLGIAEPLLVGGKEKTSQICEKIGLNCEIIDVSNSVEAAEKGVKAIRNNKAQILMKGLVKTSVLLKAVLNKEWGLRKGELLSHLAVLDVPVVDRLIFVSDGGMVIRPDIKEKVAIINNAVSFMNNIGYENPHVALLAAVEVVNESMPETLEAAVISKMAQRRQLKNCEIDGPLALDNALSEMAAKIKKISGSVAGNADLLVVPDIHSGNILGKSAIYLAGGTIAGIILGATVPIVIVSRADVARSKLASLALSAISASKN
ncbi:MAG: bifunctional enoyl-CoA hydratase/phosphate acetyltransferase [Thermotogota bacterium]|nr:bifunctional enoyl-CoA hydratase/phosphate acetyltransferase [Thermotogota bacterium]